MTEPIEPGGSDAAPEPAATPDRLPPAGQSILACRALAAPVTVDRAARIVEVIWSTGAYDTLAQNVQNFLTTIGNLGPVQAATAALNGLAAAVAAADGVVVRATGGEDPRLRARRARLTRSAVHRTARPTLAVVPHRSLRHPNQPRHRPLRVTLFQQHRHRRSCPILETTHRPPPADFPLENPSGQDDCVNVGVALRHLCNGPLHSMLGSRASALRGAAGT